MKPSELFERINTNLLVVDIQPAYDKWCRRITPQICQLLNRQIGKKVVLFNGDELTNDRQADVIDYYLENGLNDDVEIDYIEKEYGFFRSWMDDGIDDHTILKTIRAMVMQRKNDSRDLDLSVILDKDEFAEINDSWTGPIFLPDYVDINMLRKLSPFYMCGGGRNECLREIELACNAFNIRYKRLQNLIY
jgi:hypothetical protein